MDTVLFQWSDGFSIGLQEIDEQHKVLVGLVNELHEAIVHLHGSSAARDVLNRLTEYTRTHFTVEECLMRILDYPEFPQHKQMHEDLLHQVLELQLKLDSGQATITFELLHFLKLWLTKHINESDKRFGAFAVAKGLAPAPSPQGAQSTAKQKQRWKLW
jgi:hemerythrin